MSNRVAYENLPTLLTRHPLAIVILFGVLFRLALLPFVKVSADTSLYTYDALLVLDGQTPITDYATRSPLFNYIYAVPLLFGIGKMLTARLTMLIASACLAVAIFLLTRHLHSGRAAMIATVLFFVTPLSAVYGQLLYTEQITQLLVIVAVLLLYKSLAVETLSYWSALAIGSVFGVAFLIRRVVLVQFGVIGLYILYHWVINRDQSLSKIIYYGICLVGGMAATLILGYVGLGWPSVSDIVLVAKQHFVWLFQGNPVGGVAWVEMSSIPLETTSAQTVSLFPFLLNILVKITHLFAVSMPVLLPFIVLGRSYLLSQSTPQWTDTAIHTGLISVLLVGGIGRWILFPDSTVRPVLVSLVSIGAVIIFSRCKPISFEPLWDSRFSLMIGFIILVTAGYFALGSLGFVHFLDIFPYACVVASILIAESYNQNQSLLQRKQLRTGIIVVFISMILVGLISANALVVDPRIGGGQNDSLDTLSEVGAVNNDLSSRLTDGQTVFTGQPLYVVESGQRQAADLSRGYWILRYAPNSPAGERLRSRLHAQIQDGSVEYMILDKWTRVILEESPALNATVTEEFCPVADDGLYQNTGAELYIHSESAPKCSRDT